MNSAVSFAFWTMESDWKWINDFSFLSLSCCFDSFSIRFGFRFESHFAQNARALPLPSHSTSRSKQFVKWCVHKRMIRINLIHAFDFQYKSIRHYQTNAKNKCGAHCICPVFPYAVGLLRIEHSSFHHLWLVFAFELWSACVTTSYLEVELSCALCFISNCIYGMFVSYSCSCLCPQNGPNLGIVSSLVCSGNWFWWWCGAALHSLSFNFWLFSISFWVANLPYHQHKQQQQPGTIILIHSLLILRTLNHTAHTIHICHDIFRLCV